MKSSLSFLIKLIFVFALLYDINFAFIPSLTTARLSFLFLFLFTVKKHKLSISKSTVTFLGVCIFILIIAIMQFFFSAESSQMSRLFWFTVYGIITPTLFVKHIKDRNELFLLVTFATAIQAVISILAFITPSLKALLYSIVIFTANFDETVNLRAVGFASIGGAGLSVIQSLGVISILLLFKFNKYQFLVKAFYWLLLLIVVISTLIIGRTGLILSLIYIGLYFITTLRVKSILSVTVIIFVLLQINYTSLIEKYTTNVEGFDVELFSNWVTGAFDVQNNATKDDLSSMPVPPIALKTIIGTGTIMNKGGVGNSSGNDSGYIQTYYSLGLIMAALFYICYLIFLIVEVEKKKQRFLYFLLIVLFFIEIKEPFIFYYMFPFFILSCILLINNIPVYSVSNDGKTFKNRLD